MNDIAHTLPVGNPLSAPSTEEDVGLGEILRILQRRLWAIAAVLIPIMAITGVALFFITPRYTAETLIMIESDGSHRAVSLDSVVAGISGDSESVQSEAHVLGSRALANRVATTLGLHDDPEFQAEDTSLSPAATHSTMIDNFLDRLTVVPLENSRVIAVRFSSENADKAAQITNAIANEYLKARLETKFELTAQANTWLAERIQELRGQVVQAEASVERTRGELGLLEADGLTLAARELTELNTQLILARSTLAESEAKLQDVERLSRGASGADSMLEVLESPLIQRLREQEAEVERRVAELSSELGKLHPRMIQLRAEAADLKQRIDNEISKIVAGQRNQVNISQARVASLNESLEDLKARVTVVNQNEIELRALEREADASRTLLNTLLARQKETISQDDQDFQQPDATIISPADVPAEPSYPRPTVVLGLAFIGSLFLGMLVVMSIELLDGGFRSGEQFENATGIPSIGFIPAVKKPNDYDTLAGFVAGQPGTPLGESMRTVHWSLKLAFPDRPPKVVLLTSSTTGEGKSVVASCLATSQCMVGQKVLLIDADIRRPSTHETIGVARDPGLTNVLAKEVDLKDALVQSDWSGLTVLPAGTPNPHAPSLLGSDAMKLMLNGLKSQFDLIIIDSPPTMVATDARILCQLADATVLLAKWGKTRRNVVRLSARQLKAAGANLAGGLLTMVDTKRNAHYGYGDSSAYSGAVASYFPT